MIDYVFSALSPALIEDAQRGRKCRGWLLSAPLLPQDQGTFGVLFGAAGR